MQNIHPSVVHRKALRSVFGADAHEMLAAFAQEFDGFDDDRVFEALELENGFGGRLFEGVLTDSGRACALGSKWLRRLSRKRRRRQRQRSGASSKAEEIAARICQR